MPKTNPTGFIASAAFRSDYTRVSTLASLLVEENQRRNTEMLARVRTHNVLGVARRAQAPVPAERSERYKSPTQRRVNRQRTLRGVALVVIAATFDTASQYIEFQLATSRPQAVLIVTALAASAMVAIDTWLIPALVRHRNRKSSPTCKSYTRTTKVV